MANAPATLDRIKDDCYTTLCILGEYDDAFMVIGGADIGGDLTVAGDGLIGGDLTVLGTLNATISSVVTDNTICLNVPPLPDLPTDITADGGGLCLEGDTTKSIFWYNSNDTWRFNQSINLGVGISTSHPGDNSISGTDYMIDDISVLNATTLGSGVIISNLEELGTVRVGDIDTTGTITDVTSGVNTVITTAENHGMTTGDIVRIITTDSTPSISGYFTATVIGDKTFQVAVTTSDDGTTGSFIGGGFSIQMGDSPISAGDITAVNGSSIIALNTSDVPQVTISGELGQIKIETSDSSQDTNLISESYLDGTFTGNFYNTNLTHVLNSSDFLGGESCALNVTSQYTGGFTGFVDQENSLKSYSACFSAESTNATSESTQIATNAESVTDHAGANLTSVVTADNADKSNIGFLALSGIEASDPTSIGIWGTVNVSSSDAAIFAESTWISGVPIHAAIVGYNPLTSSDQYAFYGVGDNLFDGDTIMDGDLTVTGSLNATSISFSTVALGIEEFTSTPAPFVLDPDVGMSEITITATTTATMAAAAGEGQLKVISIVGATASDTVTVTLPIVGGTTLTFSAAAQSVTLISTRGSGDWVSIHGGAVLA